MATPSPSIICVDCGGPAHLITLVHDDHVWTPGEVVAYRCRDCRDRWDLVLTDEDLNDEGLNDEGLNDEGYNDNYGSNI